jgi:hypothetical protein
MASPATSTGPAATPAPSGRPQDESVRVLLSVSRSLALLFALLAGVLFLLLLGLGVLTIVLGGGLGEIVAAVYCLASAAINFAIWKQLPGLEALAAQKRYAALREPLLIWGILGVLFFVVVGILLLVAWVKAELLVSAPSA